jgi:hypothetical protein
VPAGAPTAVPAGFTPAPEGLWPLPPDNAVRYGPFGRARRRRPWDGGAWAAIGILAAAALVIGVVLAETPKTKPGTTLNTGTAATAAFVSQAAQATMAKRSANVTLSGTVQVPGQAAVVIDGTGVFGLSGDVATLNATYSGAGGSGAEKEIMVNGSIYASVSLNGKSEVLPGGKTWVQMSLPQARTGTQNLGLGTDPSSVLSALEARGYSVQALGTKLIDGRVCSGYGISGGLQTVVPMAITIWVDQQHLVRELGMSATLSVAGKVVSENMTADFTSFGGPVQVTAPPPASVISYAAYLQAVGQGNVPALRVLIAITSPLSSQIM